MTLRRLRDTELSYHLISYDPEGVERVDDPAAPDGLMSEAVLGTLNKEPISDVFICSHGWMNDFVTAIKSYDLWMGAMARCEQDLISLRQVRPDFCPLLIGLHWPSKPFGNEDLTTEVAFGASGGASVAELIEQAADGIADTPESRKALQTIFEAALKDMSPETMPQEVVEAYRILWHESGLTTGGPEAAPGDEAELFDPEALFEDELEQDISFSGGIISGLLAPLRPLSFWKMKKRARLFGESGGGNLLRMLQSQSGPDVRFHLMGHSFGCVVTSAMVAGEAGDSPLLRPVDSMFLVQGAVSCWAYTPEIPIAKGKSGYFSSISSQRRILGPLLTTQSRHDHAVGTAYRLTTTSRSVSFAPPGGGSSSSRRPAPPNGSLGTFGIQGPSGLVEHRPMMPADGDYGFEAGKIYNLDSSAYICEGRIPLLGAHCDIAKPEVAHAFWSAVQSRGR